MKDYINLFHSMISEIHFWENYDKKKKKKNFIIFRKFSKKLNYLVDYFDDFKENLSKKTLNSYLKSVSKHNYGCTKTKTNTFKNRYEKS